MSQEFQFSRRSDDWIEENLPRLAAMHTDAMAGYWDEQWSNDPQGEDTRAFSPALIREYAKNGAVFFSAEKGELIAGYGILLPITESYLCKHCGPREWACVEQWKDPKSKVTQCSPQATPQVGDMELALVITDDSCKGCGVFSRLAEMRLYYAYATLENGRNIWLQTLERPAVSTVSRFYAKHGFELIARVDVKSTERIVMASNVNIKDHRDPCKLSQQDRNYGAAEI